MLDIYTAQSAGRTIRGKLRARIMGANWRGDDLIETLESHGEEWVRAKLLEGTWAPGTLNGGRVRDWLDTKESARRDAKEAESLSISRRALCNSKWANIIAIIAVIVSVTVAIIQILKG